jgi:hypothetical protein
MYVLYLEQYEPGIVLLAPRKSGAGDGGDDEANIAEEMQQKALVKYDFYLESFRKFDLGFGKPEVDSCGTCDSLAIKLSVAEDEETAEGLRTQRRLHLLEADKGYAMRRHDQELAQVIFPTRVYTFPVYHYHIYTSKQCRKDDADWTCPSKEYRSWDSIEYVCSDMAGVLPTPKVCLCCFLIESNKDHLHILLLFLSLYCWLPNSPRRCPQTRHGTSAN